MKGIGKSLLRRVHDWYRIYTRSIFIFLSLLALLGGATGYVVWRYNHTPSPVPSKIKSQADFKIAYPKGYEIDKSSWSYTKSEEAVSFKVPNNGNPIVFTERAVPLSYKDDTSAYDRFVGSLKPITNFKVPLGTVSIVGFVTAGDYSPEGKSGILKTKETLIIAHPKEIINDTEWYKLFNSLVEN